MGKKGPPGVPSKITFIFFKDSFPSLLFVGFFPKLLGSFVGNGGAWDPQPLGFRHWDTKFRSLWGANQRRPTSKVLTWGQPYGTFPPGLMDNVRFVASTDTAFAAVKMDGTIRVWGDPKSGGSFCTLRGVQAPSWGHDFASRNLWSFVPNCWAKFFDLTVR